MLRGTSAYSVTGQSLSPDVTGPGGGKASESTVETSGGDGGWLAQRHASGLALIAVLAWLVVLLTREHPRAGWPSGRLALSVSILVAVALMARGLHLGRPVTPRHATAAIVAVLAGLGAHLLSLDLLGDLVIAGAGVALTWPTLAPPHPEWLPRVATLVNATHGDPLAPFVMQSRKSPFFDADGTAMLAYHTKCGFAVVSGDPIGDSTHFADLVRDFATMCRGRGWRILVLGCSERRLGLWAAVEGIHPPLRAIPFGRDVVIDVARFDMVGRAYRNLRQAVQRTHNLGVSTELVAETELTEATRAELTEVLFASHAGVRTERGFSMILDGALEGRYPGVLLMIARDRSGRVQAFHRYAVAGDGNDISLDVPWRRPGAPNGIDERLSVDMIAWAREHGGRRVSLAFAAFPEIFDDQTRGPMERLFYVLIHLGDRLIRLESLYRYLRKYHALGERRYVLVPLRQLPAALVVLLSLEFMPHRRRLPGHVTACQTGP